MNMQGNLGRNIPQPQGMPQGIASLGGMQRPQQQPQQQGPQGLQNIPQDLMRALGVRAALEAEEEAKKQIAAMTQQALDQQIPQTPIAQQDFEKLKTAKLAEMTGQIGNQQAAEQQQAMQQLMAGIARAPGAGDGFARMAGGGIVAFQNRGEVPPEELSVEERIKRALARLLGRKPEEGPREWEEAPQGEEPDLMGETLIRPPKEPDPFALVGGERLSAPVQSSQAAPAARSPQAPAMRMPPAQVRSKVPAGVAGAVRQPVVRPDSTGQGISPPAPQQAAPSFTQDLMAGLSKYQGQEFENMSKLAKELYALPPEVRQIYEQRIAQAKQPKGIVGLFAELGGYDPGKGISSAYNRMMATKRAGVTSAEDALIRAQETARLKAAETALGARGKAAETFGQIAGVGERARATDVSAAVQREQIASQAQTAAMDREVRLKVANIQASAARGDDKAKLAVERLKAVMDDPQLKELAKQAAVNPTARAQYNQRLDELIRQLAPEFANKPAAPAAGTASNDPLGIRK